MRWARGRRHLRANGVSVRPGPPCPGTVVADGGKGTQVARTLTWQYLLPRRRQQQSRQLLAPSSAATSSSTAATNHPSGTAKRQSPASRCPPRPRTPSGREGYGRRRKEVRPLGSGSGAGKQEATASQSRGAEATKGLRGSAEGSAGPWTQPRLGLLLSTLSLPPRSMPGNSRPWGEGGRGAPGRPGSAQWRRAVPEVDGLPGMGTTQPPVAAGCPVIWLSFPEPGRLLGRRVSVLVAVGTRTTAR